LTSSKDPSPNDNNNNNNDNITPRTADDEDSSSGTDVETVGDQEEEGGEQVLLPPFGYISGGTDSCDFYSTAAGYNNGSNVGPNVDDEPFLKISGEFRNCRISIR
jgi:hypothetical protein